jgi:hypothetical protein
MELTLNNRKSESDKLITYHRNIRSLSSKKDVLSAIFEEECFSPHLVCISEHHMVEQELLNFSMPGYKLASSYCQNNLDLGKLYLLKKQFSH